VVDIMHSGPIDDSILIKIDESDEMFGRERAGTEA
jgi:hypothetical protein